MKYRDGAEYAMEKMLRAEAKGRFVEAVWWADGRDRIIAADTKNGPAYRSRRGLTLLSGGNHLTAWNGATSVLWL